VLTQLLAFLAVSAVVICTPGQDTALTVRNALVGGRRHGVYTAAGVSVAQAVWTVATSLGLAGVLRASEPAFLALRVAGVAYLVWLGARSLYSAWRGGHREGDTGSGAAVGARPTAGRTPAAAMRQGIVSNLANPKMAAFFISLLPQFVPAGGPALPVMMLLGLLFCALTFVWLALYSLAVARARRLLDRPRVRRAMDAVAGVAFLGFGARLAVTADPP
jgi:threonine/homoserine/homoserine lactone efflux protein